MALLAVLRAAVRLSGLVFGCAARCVLIRLCECVAMRKTWTKLLLSGFRDFKRKEIRKCGTWVAPGTRSLTRDTPGAYFLDVYLVLVRLRRPTSEA